MAQAPALRSKGVFPQNGDDFFCRALAVPARLVEQGGPVGRRVADVGPGDAVCSCGVLHPDDASLIGALDAGYEIFPGVHLLEGVRLERVFEELAFDRFGFQLWRGGGGLQGEGVRPVACEILAGVEQGQLGFDLQDGVAFPQSPEGAKGCRWRDGKGWDAMLSVLGLVAFEGSVSEEVVGAH